MMFDIVSLVLLLALGACIFFGMRRLMDRSRLARRLQLAEGRVARRDAEKRFAQRAAIVKGSLARVFTILGTLMPLGEDDRHKIALSLQRAGFQSSNAVTIVLGTKFACVLTGLAAGLILLTPMMPGILGVGLGVVGGLLGGVMLNLIPELIVGKLASGRLFRIQSALPDALDLMIVCLEAGLTFERALRRTVNDLKTFQPVLAAELRQASLDMSVHGRNREEALSRVAERLDSQDLRDLTTTVAQSERHGTPTADALRRLAGSVRVETIARTQAKMARLPTLLVIPAISCLLPGILVLVGGPSLIQLINQLSSVQ